MTSEITPLQRARMREAALAIKEGRKSIPFRCAFCRSSSLTGSETDTFGVLTDRILECVSCGRQTRRETAQAERKREMKAFIEEGIDLPMPGKRGLT